MQSHFDIRAADYQMTVEDSQQLTDPFYVFSLTKLNNLL